MSLSLADSYASCRKLARRTGRNFYYSFAGLPRDQFRAMCVLYSYMRLCDDIGDDESQPLPARIERLAEWEAATTAALTTGKLPHTDFGTGRPEFRDIFPAVIDMTHRYGIPLDRLTQVIHGVRMDLLPVSASATLSGHAHTPATDAHTHNLPAQITSATTGEPVLTCRFETFEELEEYCFHVAGVVGVCCIHIWGFTDDAALDSAEDCGLAFQLTNILRDIGEDADTGRIYIPSEELVRFDLSPADLASRVQDERFQKLMKFQVTRAETYYEKAETLFDYLTPTGHPVLRAMMRLYGGLLAQIPQRNYDVYTRRISLPAWRKLLIAADAAIHRHFP